MDGLLAKTYISRDASLADVFQSYRSPLIEKPVIILKQSRKSSVLQAECPVRQPCFCLCECERREKKGGSDKDKAHKGRASYKAQEYV